MTWLFDTIKGRLVVVLISFLSLSHLLGLWLYVQKSDEATTLLHDALLAEQIALMTRLVDRFPAVERGVVIEALSGPIIRIQQAQPTAPAHIHAEGSRAHTLEHFLGVKTPR